jgi:hypothetical protein
MFDEGTAEIFYQSQFSCVFFQYLDLEDSGDSTISIRRLA